MKTETKNYSSFLISKLNRQQLNRKAEQFLNHVLSIIEQHISDPAFDTFFLAKECEMSRMHLHRKLKILIDLSPRALIRNIRLHHATHLLEENAGTVSQIAHQVGFRNASHFAKIFKELFGVTPSNFNSELRKTFE